MNRQKDKNTRRQRPKREFCTQFCTLVMFPPNTLFTAFIATVEKIIKYALGEHNPGSGQNWRTSNDSAALIAVDIYKCKTFIWGRS